MLVSQSRRQKHRELELQAYYTVNPELVVIVHDERCSKTEKHAPSQAGGGLEFRGRETTGARAGRVAGGDG